MRCHGVPGLRISPLVSPSLLVSGYSHHHHQYPSDVKLYHTFLVQDIQEFIKRYSYSEDAIIQHSINLSLRNYDRAASALELI